MLSRFVGRPDRLSPRAWFRSRILGYRQPFDRHDWYVETSAGQLRRYIIDFYSGSSSSSSTPAQNDKSPSVHLDVRPALDSWEAVCMRFSRFFIQKNKD